MDRIWAPWRVQYVENGEKTPPHLCLFDELPQRKNDRESLLLHRAQKAYVVLNAYPYTNGHLMVVPYKHTADLENLRNEELLEINQLLSKCIQVLKKTYQPDGFNIGINLGKAAGAGIPDHIHWHIVPRWAGDTNFMTTLGETRVMPEDLLDSYDRLKKVFENAVHSKH